MYTVYFFTNIAKYIYTDEFSISGIKQTKYFEIFYRYLIYL